MCMWGGALGSPGVLKFGGKVSPTPCRWQQLYAPPTYLYTPPTMQTAPAIHCLLYCLPARLPADGTSYTASVSEFAHLYADKPTALMLLAEYVLNTCPHPPNEQTLVHTLLELYLQVGAHTRTLAHGKPAP